MRTCRKIQVLHLNCTENYSLEAGYSMISGDTLRRHPWKFTAGSKNPTPRFNRKFILGFHVSEYKGFSKPLPWFFVYWIVGFFPCQGLPVLHLSSMNMSKVSSADSQGVLSYQKVKGIFDNPHVKAFNSLNITGTMWYLGICQEEKKYENM